MEKFRRNPNRNFEAIPAGLLEGISEEIIVNFDEKITRTILKVLPKPL